MPRRRRWPARIAAPAALLVAATVAVLLVRDGLRRGSSDSPPSVVTTTATTTPPGDGRARFYTVRLGDTLSLIAEERGTTVERLIQLNPGIDTGNLVPGQRLRIE